MSESVRGDSADLRTAAPSSGPTGGGHDDARTFWHRFGAERRVRWALLPHDLNELCGDWGQLRSAMARGTAPDFERDEWAYLMTFVDPAALLSLLEDELGAYSGDSAASPRGAVASTGQSVRMLRPRSPWAIWLPSNVSLLGPLLVAVASLTGSAVHLKAGSEGSDLAANFVAWAREHAGAGPLARWLSERVRVERFDRHDPRNRTLAESAALRIAFGSETSIAAIDALAHSPASPLLAFGDRVSQAFVDPELACETSVAEMLIRTFAIYGSAGCTSPRRVVLLGGTTSDAAALRDRLAERWGTVVRRDPTMAGASQNFATFQLARAAGWEARLVARSAAVVSAGALDCTSVPGTQHLEIVTADLDRAVRHLPPNIQTVGLACAPVRAAAIVAALAATPVQRIVPLAQMHHFGGVWDGASILASAFEHVAVTA